VVLLRIKNYTTEIKAEKTVSEIESMLAQYGEAYQKPTDIWNNLYQWVPRPVCSPGDTCHESSPRGCKNSGIQGINDSVRKAIVPRELCEELLSVIENRNPINQTRLNVDILRGDGTGKPHCPFCTEKRIRKLYLRGTKDKKRSFDPVAWWCVECEKPFSISGK